MESIFLLAELLLVISLAVFGLLFILPLIPGVVSALSNKPNRFRPPISKEANLLGYGKSSFGFFTELQPGRVKMIELIGGRFVRAIMATPGRMFQGERLGSDLQPNESGYWRVLQTRTGRFNDGRRMFADKDSHPIPFPKIHFFWFFYFPYSILWWVWKRWVYKITGAVFSGIWPFQRIRTYPMERFSLLVSDGSQKLGDKTLPRGTIILERTRDYSDHYRILHFQFPVLIPDANTKDKIAVSVLANIIAVDYNPYLTAYETDDDWSARFLSAISNAVTGYVRVTPLEDVLSSTSDVVEHRLSKEIAKVGQQIRDPDTGAITEGDAYDFGIAVPEENPPQILDISAADEGHQKQLAEVALAKVSKEADKERARGKAAYIRKEGLALREFPEGALIPAIEGQIRAAEAASKGGGIVILGTSQSENPMLAAILREIRNRDNQGSRDQGGAPSN